MDYNFVTRERFVAMREAGGFLEWAEVFGNLYGTGRADTERRLAGGDDLVLVIDVQGAAKVRASGVAAVAIFVLPPSFEMLEERLRGRSRDPEEQIRRRLAVARQEIYALSGYDYVVVNDEVDTASSACGRSCWPSAAGRTRCSRGRGDRVVVRRVRRCVDG